MRSRTIAAAAIGVAAFSGTAAQAARAASTVAVDQPCYLSGGPINSTGTGFTPGGPVNYTFDGRPAASGVADGAGNVAQPLTAPILALDTIQHSYSLAAQDQTNPALAATTTVTVTRQVATVTPHRARPKRKVKFGVHGMPPGATVWLHYVFHGKQRYVKKLGRPKAPCGTLTVRRRFFPVNRPRTGTWTFQFDNRRHYSKSTLPRIRGPVQIFNVFK